MGRKTRGPKEKKNPSALEFVKSHGGWTCKFCTLDSHALDEVREILRAMIDTRNTGIGPKTIIRHLRKVHGAQCGHEALSTHLERCEAELWKRAKGG